MVILGTPNTEAEVIWEDRSAEEDEGRHQVFQVDGQ